MILVAHLTRCFPSVIVSDVAASAAFYETLLGMSAHFSSDWFVILTHPAMPGLEFGLLSKTSDITHDALREAPAGVLLTFVVDDVDAVHRRAQEMGACVLEPPRDLFYGQRSLLVRDRDGAILDISAPVAARPGDD